MENKTVVIVEDNDLNLKLIKAVFTRNGYMPFLATDAESGIELIKKRRPDLIMMDIQLPGMDGITATTILKKDPDIKDIPIIGLSAHAMDKYRQNALDAGCCGYITKPISTRTFMLEIDNILSERQVPNANGPTQPVKPRVLIVDDDPLNIKLLLTKLPKETYEIQSTTSGSLALDLIPDFGPDIILLDVLMPDMNGFEVLKRTKANPATKHIPVVLVTQLDSLEDKTMGLEAGADDFINKPYNTEELRARIHSLLRMKRYGEQLSDREESARRLYTRNRADQNKDLIQSNRQILIVEHNLKDAQLLKKRLQTLKCRLEFASSGADALQIVRSQRPDVVVLNIMLPDIDGWEVCRRIKSDEYSRNTQILIVTRLKDLDSRIRSIEAGTDDYIQRPIEPDELRARVLALLKKKTYLDGLVDKMAAAVKTSITDSLTGLYARGYLQHFLDLELQRAERHSHNLSLIMIDADDFKHFNDTFGHLAGDEALSTLARVIRDNIRETDLPSRYGGEEFLIVLPYSDHEAAAYICQRIQSAVRKMRQKAQKKETKIPTISMGVSTFPRDGRTIETLIEQADQALYAAKREGKNCYQIANRIQSGERLPTSWANGF